MYFVVCSTWTAKCACGFSRGELHDIWGFCKVKVHNVVINAYDITQQMEAGFPPWHVGNDLTRLILYDRGLQNEMCPWSKVLLRKWSSSFIREITHILWNPLVHCRVYKSTPLVRVLDQMNPMYDPNRSSFKIHFNIIPHLCLSLWRERIFFQVSPLILPTLLFGPMHFAYPTHLILLNFINQIIFGEVNKSWGSVLYTFVHRC